MYINHANYQWHELYSRFYIEIHNEIDKLNYADGIF